MVRAMMVAGALVAFLSVLARGGAADPVPGPTPSPTPDATAEALFAKAKAVWRSRTDLPYIRYGALIRYLHNGHVFDNWWDAYDRTADGQIALERLADADEEHRRLSGVAFSIFGLKVFDTNPDAEPIRLEEPRFEPTSSFGVVSKFGGARTSPDAPLPTSSPSPQAGDDLREIGRVAADAREYRVTDLGLETLRDGPAVHLRLEPLRDPTYERLRDLWLDPTTDRTMQLRVAGILRGEPYDRIDWTVHYVELDGRNYLQQVVADEPLKFGFDTVIPKFEIDLVDYHFPTEVPKYTFDKPFSL